MREWTELYRDMLSAYNALAEAIATAKTLRERDTRRIAELAAERDELLARAEAAEAERNETNEFIDNIIDALDYPICGDEVFLSEIVEVVAALRAQLAALKAAGEWRLVSERPDSSACLYEVTVRASWDGDVFMTHGNLYMPHDGPDILRWRPAPPQE